MKLPQLNSTAVGMHQQAFYTTSTMQATMQAGIHPNGFFDSIGDVLGSIGSGIGGVITGGIGKIPCILSKAGPKGIECFTRCGLNAGCLASCAGPSVVNAILSC
jgi:hypothetical protein